MTGHSHCDYCSSVGATLVVVDGDDYDEFDDDGPWF